MGRARSVRVSAVSGFRSRIFVVDAFTDRPFGGNPAAVMPLERFPDEATLASLAAENNLSETAFVVPDGTDYRIRWFTPALEVPLCGHATLASGAVVLDRIEPGRRSVVFRSASGPLTVQRSDGGFRMDFPSRPSRSVPSPPALTEALGATPRAVRANEFNLMAIFDDPAVVRRLEPDLAAIGRIDTPGVIVTAPGDGPYDFVSRYFAPAKGIPEDPVTGAAHCMLAPYWAERLGKAALDGYQASRRGGRVRCRLRGDRVELEGSCRFYLEGTVVVPDRAAAAPPRPGE